LFSNGILNLRIFEWIIIKADMITFPELAFFVDICQHEVITWVIFTADV
jgi:hypothetical protein